MDDGIKAINLSDEGGKTTHDTCDVDGSSKPAAVPADHPKLHQKNYLVSQFGHNKISDPDRPLR